MAAVALAARQQHHLPRGHMGNIRPDQTEQGIKGIKVHFTLEI